MNQLSIRGLDPALWRRVRVAAAQAGVPMGEIVARALAEWLKRQDQTAGPVSGTYTLTANGRTSANLPLDASAADIQETITALMAK